MPVERGRPPSRALLRPLATLLLGAVVALTAAVAPLASSPAVHAEEDDGSAPVTVVAAPAASGILRQGTMLTVRVTISNDTGVALDAGQAVLSVDEQRVATAPELEAWFTGQSGSHESPGSEVVRVPVPSLEPGGVAVLDLVVSAADLSFGDTPGPRRALVEHVVAGTAQGATATALVWLPAAEPLPSTPASIIVPLVTPGVDEGLLSADQLSEFTAPRGALSRTLDAVEGHRVTLAIDPRILASIRLLGDDAPPSSIDLLERLADDANPSFALGWADADPGLPLLAGSAGITPPTEVWGPEGPALLENLIEWDHELPAVSWPSAGALSTEVVDTLVEQGATTVITPRALVRGEGDPGRNGPLLVIDGELSQQLSAAASARSAQSAASAETRAAALLAAAAVEGRPAVAALDRDDRSATRLEGLLDALDALPWWQPAPLSSIPDATESRPEIRVDDDAESELVAAAARALEAESADVRFTRITSTPEPLVSQRRLELLAALSPGWEAQRITALEGFITASERLRSSVQVIESSTITLLTDRTSLPITVENSLPVPVTVSVRVAPATGELRVVDPHVQVTVEPASRTQALVPVQSLTNGTVDITVTLRDDAGTTVGDAATLELNLQAGWETAGTVAIAAIIALLFVVGIVRDVRKRRRRHHGLSSTAHPGDEAGGGRPPVETSEPTEEPHQ